MQKVCEGSKPRDGEEKKGREKKGEGKRWKWIKACCDAITRQYHLMEVIVETLHGAWLYFTSEALHWK